ncbi:MAG: helix-turn-helix domain-containing protein [Deltaproteobacteria bacterium]|nr:helix-turn-helix domain-containing protein [Deltaproteobacteria bacterium]
MGAKYRVELTDDERDELVRLTGSGKCLTREFVHARILLLCDFAAGAPGWLDGRAADALGITPATVLKVKRRFIENGLEAAVDRKTHVFAKFGGGFEKKLLALASSSPPKGKSRWTHRLLARTLVERGVIDTISPTTVEKMLKARGISFAERGEGNRDDQGRWIRVRNRRIRRASDGKPSRAAARVTGSARKAAPKRGTAASGTAPRKLRAKAETSPAPRKRASKAASAASPRRLGAKASAAPRKSPVSAAPRMGGSEASPASRRPAAKASQSSAPRRPAAKASHAPASRRPAATASQGSAPRRHASKAPASASRRRTAKTAPASAPRRHAGESSRRVAPRKTAAVSRKR